MKNALKSSVDIRSHSAPRSRANAAAAGREDAYHKLNGNSPRLLRQGAPRVAARGADPRGCHRSNDRRKAMIDHIYLPGSLT